MFRLSRFLAVRTNAHLLILPQKQMDFNGCSRSTLAPAQRPGSKTTHENIEKHPTSMTITVFVLLFVVFGSPTPRGRKKPKIAPRNPSQSLRGAPGDPEIDQLFTSGGARGPPNEFFGGPRPPPRAMSSAPGAHLRPTWRPEAPWRAPGPHFRPSGGSLGSIFFDC